MTVQHFDLAALPPTPWKNGGGSTREVACWPEHSGLQDFGWRVSVASIASAGPFSSFPSIDRQIMLLEGDGVQLASAGWQHTLDRRWQPLAFSGDDAVDCTLLGGASTDFNLMLRRGAWTGSLRVLQEAPPPARAGLCMVLQGCWKGPRMLEPGQGLWWVDAPGAHLEPVPGEGAAAPVLAWVALERCAPQSPGGAGA